MDLEAESNNSKLIERPLLCYMVGNKSGWTIEDCERLGIFDVFNIFGISSSVPDLSGNTIVKKARKEEKVFLACVGLPFDGATEDEIRRKLLNHLEAPFRKEFPWDKQNIDFYGIEIDEVVDGFKNTDKDGKRNMNIDILHEVLKQFKIDYPDKKIFIWGVSRCQNEDSRLFKEVVSPLVDYYIAQIYILESDYKYIESERMHRLMSFKKFDEDNHTQIFSKIIIGLGFFTAPDMNRDNLPNKDYKIHMEKQLWTIQNSRYCDEKSSCDLKRLGVAIFQPSDLKEDEINWMDTLLMHYIINNNSTWIGDGSPEKNPNLPLHNPSFEDTTVLISPMFGWQYQVGIGGNISVEKNEDMLGTGVNPYAKVPQPARSYPDDKLPRFAHVLLMKKWETPNSIWQEVRLDPKKIYSLEVFAKYVNNVNSAVPAKVILNNAKLITNEKKLISWGVPSDKSSKKTMMHWTQFFIVFQPAQEKVKVVLSDEDSKKSEAIIWDFVQLQPYYTGDVN